MGIVGYREVEQSDIPAMAQIRAAEWGTEEYWTTRIAGYMGAKRICVDVDPANAVARRFYTRNGAEHLNEHWMVWNDIGKLLRGEPRSQ
jgi:hypothetical protein